MVGDVLVWAGSVLALLLAATVVFDAVHALLHRWMRSPSPVLRALGDLHGVHHRFLGADLEVHPEYERANLVRDRRLGIALLFAFIGAFLWSWAATDTDAGQVMFDASWMDDLFARSAQLLCLGAVREILGAGALFGVELFHEGFQDWVVMILPSGGFFTLAGWVLLFNWMQKRKERRTAAVEGGLAATEGAR